jgi:hypothetical protein
MASFGGVNFAVLSITERAGTVLEIEAQLRMTKDAWRTMATMTSKPNVRPIPGGNRVVIQSGHGHGDDELNLDGERLRAFLIAATAQVTNSEGEMAATCTFLVPPKE